VEHVYKISSHPSLINVNLNAGYTKPSNDDRLLH